VASPLFSALPLARYGLEWVHPPLCLAHPLDAGPAAWLDRSVTAVVRDLGTDGPAYRALIGGLADAWDDSVEGLLGPPLSLPGAGLARWSTGLRSADAVARSFSGARGRALFAGLAAHSMIPLERRASAGVGLALAAAGHAAGWPFPRGGTGSLTAALVALLEDLGGEVITGRRVRSLLDVPPAPATVLDLTPRPIARLLADSVPPAYRRALSRFRYGPGAYKLDWALSEPIPWTSEACRRAGTVHVGGTFEEIARAERAAWTGQGGDRPFVLVAQPSRFDSTRTPDEGHTGWAYCHVPHGSSEDWTDRIEAQVERFAPGFRECIRARSVTTPADFEKRNANLIGGDIGGGALTLGRIMTGPVLRRDPYTTPLPHVFVCSASTPPGAGVHGMCGFHAARSVLRRRFGIHVPTSPARALGPRLREFDSRRIV
ncbi:MAG: phytoene desaturase family protein, partial [Gemmatimonadota bacterium]